MTTKCLKRKAEAEEEDEEEPESLCCPISHQIMQSPVMASDGHTYDERSLAIWFAGGHTESPITREPLNMKWHMLPNRAMKALIDQWKLKRNQKAAKEWDRKWGLLEAGLVDKKDEAEWYLELGRQLFEGKGIAEDRQRAVDLLRKAADAGHVPAMSELADCLMDMSFEQDPSRREALLTEAERYARAAKEQGCVRAIGLLGGCLLLSHSQTAEEGRRLIIEAADKGDHHSLIDAAAFFEGKKTGDLKENQACFAKYLQASVDKGQAWGFLNTAVVIVNETRVAEYAKAVDYFYRAFEQKNVDAAFLLGRMYAFGTAPCQRNVRLALDKLRAVTSGRCFSYRRSFRWTEKEVVAHAWLDLGFLTFMGEPGVLEADESKAKEYLERSLESVDARTEIEMFVRKESRLPHPTPSPKLYVYLVQLAAKHKMQVGLMTLGEMCIKGDNPLVPKDVKRGEQLLRDAATTGDGLYKLGWHLMKGSFGQDDVREATVCWQRAVDEFKHPGAKTKLGLHYISGFGRPPDPIKGVAMLRESAEQGSKLSCLCLGVLHQYGAAGVHQNDVLAKMYFERIVENKGSLSDNSIADHARTCLERMERGQKAEYSLLVEFLVPCPKGILPK